MDARVLVSHGIGGLQVKALAVVDINYIEAHSSLRIQARTSCLTGVLMVIRTAIVVSKIARGRGPLIVETTPFPCAGSATPGRAVG